MKKLLTIIIAIVISFSCFGLYGCKKQDEIIKFEEPIMNGKLTWNERLPAPLFPEGSKEVDIVIVDKMDSEINLALTSLMAIVNAEKPRLGLHERGQIADWYNYLDMQPTLIDDVYEAFKKYKSYMTKVVIYDPAVLDTINLACTVAGIEQAIVVDFMTYTTLKSHGIDTTVVKNFTGMFTNKMEVYNYMYDNYWDKCTRKIVCSIDPTNTAYLRDYGMATKSAFLWLDVTGGEQLDLTHKFLKTVPSGESALMGWFMDGKEGEGVGAASKNGMMVWGADWSESLSLYAGKVAEPVSKMSLRDITTYLNDDGSVRPYVYVAIGMSDGDNIQYVQNRLFQIWKSDEMKLADRPPISWTINPSVSEILPAVHNFYFDSLKTNFTKDSFLTGPSGIGYFYSYRMYNNELKDSMLNFYKNTNYYCKLTGINTISVWFEGMHDPEPPQEYMEAVAPVLTDVDSIYVQKSGFRPTKTGKLMFGGWDDPYNGAPYGNFMGLIQSRYGLYNGSNKTEAQFLSLQAVPWENNVMGEIMRIYNDTKRLNSGNGGKDIKFITMDQFVQLERINLGMSSTNKEV